MKSSTTLFIAVAAAAWLPNALMTPDWFKVDHKARTVTMKIVAEQSGSLWTFNGHSNGNATIVVPEGYKVTITFSNEDVLAHSIGVLERPTGPWPAMKVRSSLP